MSQATHVIQETPLDAIRLHPRNLRRQVGDVADLALSMKEHGVLEPLIVAPGLDEDGGIVLIAGHRRLAGARKANLPTVPTIVRADLDTEAKQVIAMLIENGQRADLSAIEEARGYQMALDLSGGDLTPLKLGKAVGKPTTRVKGRLGLLRLPEDFQERVHSGQVTIGDAEALVEFADEPAAMKRLLSEAGTQMFRFAVERERRRRDATRRGAENRKQLEKAGIRIVDEPASFPWSSVEKPVTQLVDPEGEAPEGHVGPVPFTPERHASCPFNAALVGRDGEITYLCQNPAEAGHVRQRQPWERDDEPASSEDRERRAQEAEEAERQHADHTEALQVAARVRHDFTRDLIHRPGLGCRAAALDAARFVVAAMWQFVAEAYDWGPDELSEFADLIGVQMDTDAIWGRQQQAVVTAITEMRSVDSLAGALLAIHALRVEPTLADDEWNEEGAALVHFLTTQGYEASPVERDLVATIVPMTTPTGGDDEPGEGPTGEEDATA